MRLAEDLNRRISGLELQISVESSVNIHQYEGTPNETQSPLQSPRQNPGKVPSHTLKRIPIRRWGSNRKALTSRDHEFDRRRVNAPNLQDT